MEKYFYYAATYYYSNSRCEGLTASVVHVHQSSNLMYALSVPGAETRFVRPCSTKREAQTVVDDWNEAYHANGSALRYKD